MLRGKRRLVVALFVLGVLGLMAGCCCPWSAKEPAGEVLEGWTLQFSDSFDRTDPGRDWKVLSGDWRIEDGMSIICTKKFPGAQRLEFVAKSDDPQPCDLTGLLCIDESGLSSGYFFGFGSEWNAYSKLLVKGKEVTRCDAHIVPGKAHHVVCERVGNRLTNIVDGKVVLTHTDDTPLKGDGHEMIGFYIFSSGKIDDVKVYTKAEE